MKIARVAKQGALTIALYAVVVGCASLTGTNTDTPVVATAAVPGAAHFAGGLALTSGESGVAGAKENADDGLTRLQLALVQAAHELVGADQLFIRGQRYIFDCSGTVMAIYAQASLNLTKHFNRYTGNGVERIHKMVEEHRKLVPSDSLLLPEPGDVVFFDNTYDRNGDGLWNDNLTHTGMVVEVLEDGTVKYVHNHYRLGIVIEQMNLRRPDVHYDRINGKNVKVNAAMRMRGTGGSAGRWLASHLTRDFGRAYEIPL